MSQSISCRLCINICNGYYSLYEANGHKTEVYVMTAKYFTTMKLDLKEAKHMSVICADCWNHISEFHTFQQSVLQTQKLHGLIDTTRETVTKCEPKDELNAADHSQYTNELVVASQSSNELGWHSYTDTMKQQSNDTVVKSEQESSSDEEELLTYSTEYIFPDQCEALNISHENASNPATISHPQQADSSFIKEEESLTISYSPNIEANNENFAQISQATDAVENESYQSDTSSDDETSDMQLQHQRPQLKTVKEFDAFIADWRPSLECALCRDTFSLYSLLRQHFHKQHPRKNCHIMCCQQKWHHPKDIEQHIHYHNQKNNFKCSKCFKTFRWQNKLQHHLKEVHNVDLYKCPKCASSFSKKWYLNQHVQFFCNNQKDKKDLPHRCHICGKSYAIKAFLGKHLKMHSQVKEGLKCSICNKEFNAQTSLNAHMATHKEDRAVPCPHCSKTFKTRIILYLHLTRDHPKEWETM